MDARISLITLGVADIARARRFYEALGFTASPAGNEHVVFFQLGGMALGLYGRDALAEDARLENGSGFGGITLAHNVRAREDVGRVLDEAEAAGGIILKPAEDVFWGGYSGYFADPDGHPWEVAWNPHFPLAEDGTIHLPA
jgi:uncharacterized protein